MLRLRPPLLAQKQAATKRVRWDLWQ